MKKIAEEHTFIGELQRGWQRFWGLSWWWKGPIIGASAFVLLIIVAGIIGGGDNETTSDSIARATDLSSEAAFTGEPSSTVTGTGTPKSTRKPTATPTAILSPEPTIVPTQAATPTPLDFVQQITKSYQDNLGFMLRASADELNIQWLPELNALVRIGIKPETVLTEGDSLTITAHSALVAGRAIWTTYPEVQQIELMMLAEFTDQFGVSETESAASITVVRATGERIDVEGIKPLIYGDNKHLFCVADHYDIHLAIYTELDDPGCLAQWGFAK